MKSPEFSLLALRISRSKQMEALLSANDSDCAIRGERNKFHLISRNLSSGWSKKGAHTKKLGSCEEIRKRNKNKEGEKEQSFAPSLICILIRQACGRSLTCFSKTCSMIYLGQSNRFSPVGLTFVFFLSSRHCVLLLAALQGILSLACWPHLHDVVNSKLSFGVGGNTNEAKRSQN